MGAAEVAGPVAASAAALPADSPALRLLIDRVRAARADRRTLAIHGGGSKAFYGEPFDARSERVDTRVLAGISSYEPSELVVTVGAGTPLVELEAVLAAKGQHLPFEPPRFADDRRCDRDEDGDGQASAGALEPAAMSCATVGGMVAAGLSGPSRAAAGSVRDHVLGATLLNGRAELLTFGGQVMKNVAGYDVSRLLAGSLGTLGVIAQVSLKVLPIAPATATLRFEIGEAAALAQLNAWAGLPLPINASAWWNGQLAVRLRGARAAVAAARVRLGGELIDPALAAPFWDGLRDQRDAFFIDARRAVAASNDSTAHGGDGRVLWRLSLPPTAPPLALAGEGPDGQLLIEWGGAQRWLCSALPTDAVRSATAAAGGHATCFLRASTGAGMSAPCGVFTPLSPPLARIHRALKAAFDPDGVFNIGRLMPGW